MKAEVDEDNESGTRRKEAQDAITTPTTSDDLNQLQSVSEVTRDIP